MDITEFEWLDPDRVDAVDSPANGTPWLLVKSEGDEPVLSEDGMVKYVSASARRKYARQGVAMANGDFPIPDEGHLRSAIGRLGNYKGDKAKAKAHIIKRARALGLTHMLPKDWHVEKAMDETQGGVQGSAEGVDVDGSLGQTRENADDEIVHGDVQNDAGKPKSEPYNQPRPDEHTGYGDTAPDKTMPETEALSQTREIHAEKNSIGPNSASSEGTVAPDRRQDTAMAEREGRRQTEEVHAGEGDEDVKPTETDPPQSQKAKGKRRVEGANPDVKAGGKADTNPGNPAWQDKDVALAAEAVAHLREALNLAAQFESREKREAKKAIKRINAAVLSLGSTGSTAVTKEIEDMTTEELLKLLDARDKAKAEKAAKAAKKEAKQAAKVAKKAAKAEGASDNPAQELAKRVANLENQPVRGRPAANGYADTRPVLRGEAPGAPGGMDLLQKAVAAAQTPQERAAVAQEFIKAKFLGNNRIQVPEDGNGNALAHGPVALVTQPPEAFANARAAMGRR